jgi:hypothetical protein
MPWQGRRASLLDIEDADSLQLQRGRKLAWSSWTTDTLGRRGLQNCPGTGRRLSEKFLALRESTRCISITLKTDTPVSNVERINSTSIFEMEVSQR